MICYFILLLLLQSYLSVPRRPPKWHGRLSSSSGAILTAACGKSTTALENPWAAILYIDGLYECGATILERQLAITAAHCVINRHVDDMNLFYGRSFQPDSGIEDRGHRNFGGQTGILAVRIHPNYDTFDKFEGNDIAVLKLTRRLQFNDYVRPIKVVPTHHKYDIMFDRGNLVMMASFGQTRGPLNSEDPDDWPDQMQLVEHKIVPEQTCNRGNDTYHFGPPQDGLCTRGRCRRRQNPEIEAAFKQICPGDSGSGIVRFFQEENQHYLIAVVSYTVTHDEKECGLSKRPSVSIKARDHIDFIYEEISTTVVQTTKAPRTSAPTTTIAPTTRATTTGKFCLTVGGGETGASCIFPFIYKNNVHTECTLIDADDGLPWCSTKVNSQGVHVVGKGKWGHCGHGCAQDTATCGTRYRNRRARIVGGVQARQGDWPWAVALGKNNGNNFLLQCGGTLINKNTVLTAAQCFDPPAPALVRLGDHDITTSNGGVLHTDIRIDRIIQHPQWNSTSKANDIAIVKLDGSVNYGKNIQPSCLPDGYKNQDLTNIIANPDPTIVGWGSTKVGGSFVNILQQAKTPVVPLAECVRAYRNVSVTILDTNLCAGRGITDTCAGDSGGPLMSAALGGVWSIVGITSFGAAECGSMDFPGVYTRVDQYVDWIRGSI